MGELEQAVMDCLRWQARVAKVVKAGLKPSDYLASNLRWSYQHMLDLIKLYRTSVDELLAEGADDERIREPDNNGEADL